MAARHVTRPAALSIGPNRYHAEEAAAAIAEGALAQMTPSRDDRLWPSDYLAFVTNPMSVAFGACGTGLLINAILGQLPCDAEQWLLEQSIDIHRYPPGLFVGLAGIARCFLEFGHIDRAEDIMLRVFDSDLRFADPTVFVGASGWGLASLDFHAATSKPAYLTYACEAGDYLLRSAEPTASGLRWKSGPNSPSLFGYASGSAGIALFLLRLFQATADERFLTAARGAIEFTIAHAREYGPALRWPVAAGAELTSPFWIGGTSGIGSVVIRFAECLNESRYRDIAEQAALGSYVPLAPSAGQFEGLAGIGEFFVDLYVMTGNRVYWERAWQLAQSIGYYAVPLRHGIAFGGRGQLRLSMDYGLGAAGVGLFLLRLSRLGPRRFFDCTCSATTGDTNDYSTHPEHFEHDVTGNVTKIHPSES